jgi:hypothetical protein
MPARPERSEAAEYYFGYIDQVGPGEISGIIATQEREAVALFEGITEERSLHRYAPDKWTIRDLLNHVNDTERLFVFRAFWFARGFDAPLPSFDQNVAVASAAADRRSWGSLIEEFRTVRGATLSFFRSLPEAAWSRRGTASAKPFTVNALAYLTAGHLIHHLRILRERYLAGE